MGTKIEQIVNEVVSQYLGVPIPAQPAVTQSTKNETHFICDSIKNHPWMAGYDIHGDGYIDATDMASITHIDEGDAIEKVCDAIKFGMVLTEEVKWKLCALVAKLPTTLPTAEKKAEVLGDIREIERDALERHSRLSQNTSYLTIASNSRSRIVEMVLRAQNIVNGIPYSEPFGVGVDLAPWPSGHGWVGLSVGGIHAASAALAAGIRPEDVILKVDGVSVPRLSEDGSLDGIYDQEQGGVRGMTGPRGSTVELTLLDSRTDEITAVEVERLIWSARTVGTPLTGGFWDASPAPELPLP